MRARCDGLVINIGSYFARYQGYVGGAAYNASKQALTGLTHKLNMEEGMHGIRGLRDPPGETVTSRCSGARPNPGDADARRRPAKMLKMEDLAALLRFVAESPPHVCVTRSSSRRTWNRLILGGGR